MLDWNNFITIDWKSETDTAFADVVNILTMQK
jgi:hypothetical protein